MKKKLKSTNYNVETKQKTRHGQRIRVHHFSFMIEDELSIFISFCVHIFFLISYVNSNNGKCECNDSYDVTEVAGFA